MLSPSQASPLMQRLQVLECFVAESDRSVGTGTSKNHVTLESCVGSGTMCVVDLTDPLLSVADANTLFTVILERFRRMYVLYFPNPKDGLPIHD